MNFLHNLFHRNKTQNDDDNLTFDESINILNGIQQAIDKITLAPPKFDILKIQNEALYNLFLTIDYSILKENPEARRIYMEIKKYFILNDTIKLKK